MALTFTSPPESLCILRLSAIGDVTHILPVLRSLQQAWPACRITWIIGKTEVALVEDITGIEFIVLDKRLGWRGIWRLRHQLHDRQFDIVLHMQASLRASILSLMLNSPIKLGFDRRRAINGQWLFSSHKITSLTRQHVLDSFFEFSKALGVERRCLRWDIPIPEIAHAWAAERLPIGQKILAINACSSQRRRNFRNWRCEHYAAVANYAVQHYQAQIVLCGGPQPQEKQFAASIAYKMPRAPLNLVGQTSLKELAAVLSKAQALLAPDTGPAHIANALGIPVIGLYAGSNPLRTGPYLSLQYCINKYPQALHKYSHKTLEQAHWGERVRAPDVMDLISVDEVIAKLDRVLAEN